MRAPSFIAFSWLPVVVSFKVDSAQVHTSTDHSAFFNMVYSLIDSLLYLVYSVQELCTARLNQCTQAERIKSSYIVALIIPIRFPLPASLPPFIQPPSASPV